jgi:phage baseplate assembly protein W
VDTSSKVRVAEARLATFAKAQASLGRKLSVDNAVAAFVGTRVKDSDVESALQEYVTEPFAQALREFEESGKKARAVRLSVWEDRIHISIE